MARSVLHRRGSDNPNWRGDGSVRPSTGRARARVALPATACSRCGRASGWIDVHHKDGDTSNNAPQNLESLCRRCHMVADGRLDAARNRGASRKGLCKLTREQLEEVRRLAGSGVTHRVLGQRFGVAHSTIGRILRVDS